jgi:hypothetical protein
MRSRQYMFFMRTPRLMTLAHTRDSREVMLLRQPSAAGLNQD